MNIQKYSRILMPICLAFSALCLSLDQIYIASFGFLITIGYAYFMDWEGS